MKRIITISREFGAGGGSIGSAVAKKLGFEYYDKEIILKAAGKSNMDIDRVMKWDEKVPSNFGFARVCSIFITDRREKSCTQHRKRSSVRSAKRENV